MPETLKNFETGPSNGSAQEVKFPPFDKANAEAERQKARDAMERTGDDRHDLLMAVERSRETGDRKAIRQAQDNLSGYVEMHPDRQHQRDMYRIANKFGNIEGQGFNEPVPNQVPEGINAATYPQLENETDEDYVDRLLTMRSKADEARGLSPTQYTEKQKRRFIAQIKRARGETVEEDENGNYKF